MNRSTTIKNLVEPTDSEDVATKNYVDSLSLNYGHIPPLKENNSKTGFVVTASSSFSSQHAPYMAFNPLLAGDISVEWVVAAGQGVGAWLQIQCPAAVRIWKIQLAGRRSNTERITSWNLAGSNGGVSSTADSGGGVFTTVLTSTTTLGSTVQEFLVNIPAGSSYNIYRLMNVVAAEPTNPGLSVFQIFPAIN